MSARVLAAPLAQHDPRLPPPYPPTWFLKSLWRVSPQPHRDRHGHPPSLLPARPRLRVSTTISTTSPSHAALQLSSLLRDLLGLLLHPPFISRRRNLVTYPFPTFPALSFQPPHRP